MRTQTENTKNEMGTQTENKKNEMGTQTENTKNEMKEKRRYEMTISEDVVNYFKQYIVKNKQNVDNTFTNV